MTSESHSELKFDIGHVLFIDIVGYSKLLINEQSEQIQKLKEIIRGTEQVRLAETEGKLLRLPTGDGGALVFRNSAEAPVLCALEINKALKSHAELKVRMGVHSGPVNEIKDLNEQANIAGAGINLAQRVMDCGDAGHILLSRRVAEDLEHYPRWKSCLHDLGEMEVKHGARVHLFNLYADGLGNPEVPEKLHLQKEADDTGSDASARRDEGFWVAVLPFKCSGSNSDLTALAEGLTEEIVTGLSRFSYLKVVSRSSTSRVANESVDVRSAAKELGARYVMDGSLRQAGSKLRLAMQLVDAVSAAHLWAETYERTFSPEAVFELQDDLVPRIVSTVADRYGILCYNMSDLVRSKSPDQLTPYESLLRCIGYAYRLTPEEHATARTCMERGVQQAPSYADGWAILSFVYSDEYGFGFNEQPDPLGRALQAARRATEAAPSNSLSQAALAKTLFFRKEFPAFRTAAEQAVSINSMDGAQLAMVGTILAYSGDWERGCALVERAMELNPRHPAWYRFPFFYNAYRQGDYVGALSVALKINMPGFFAVYEVLTAVYGQLGQQDAASQNLREMLKLIPNFGEIARALKSKWFDPELVEHVLDGLRKAGLEIAENKSSDSLERRGTFTDKPRQPENISGAAPAKSIAVLPFVNLSADKNDKYLSDGMTEELINALAKVPGLRVPGRTSCFAFKDKTDADIFRKVGDQLHVGTVLEGSVRKAGDQLRVTAQLINASDGYHLWSKNYDGDVKDIFNFQSNVAEQVVQALQVHLGAEAARVLSKKPTENLEAHRLYLLGRYEFGKYTQAGWNNAIAYYEQALQLDPEFALAYCGLADNYAYMGSVVMPEKEAIEKEKEFAQKALALDPELAEAHMSLALALISDFDWQNGLKEFDRALELNPNLAFAYELQAWTVNGLGRFDEAVAKTRKAVELDPLNPFFQMSLSFFQYWARQYDDAIAQARKTLAMDPNSAISHVLLGLSFLKKGDTAGAIAELQKARAPNPGAWYQGYLGYAYAISGDRAKADQASHELEELAKHQYVSPIAFATIYLGLGQKEKCLDWLEKSYEHQDSACWYLKIDQIYDSVRNEPRFQALVQKVFGSNV
jgi:serine/threonine-protein kinase